MGLIKAAVGAIGGTLHDQWKDYIKCEDLGQDVLMRRVSTPNGVISKDSAIQVSPGQIAVIFDSGKILDATAEEATALEQYVMQNYPGTEAYFIDGGQEIYSYIIIAE